MDSVQKMCGCGVESVRVIKLTLKKQFNCYKINSKRATYACAALAYANSWSPFTYSFFLDTRGPAPRPPSLILKPIFRYFEQVFILYFAGCIYKRRLSFLVNFAPG